MGDSFACLTTLAGPGCIGAPLYRDLRSPCVLWSGFLGHNPKIGEEVAPLLHQGVDEVEEEVPIRWQRLKALVLDLLALWGGALLGSCLCGAL